MQPITRKFSLISAALFALASSVAAGCLETSGAADRAEPAEPAEGEATAESQQHFDLSCDPTAITPDRTFTTAPAECVTNKALSLGDMYSELFCSPYVVEYSYKPKNIGASWDHNPWSEAECNAMRASVTIYTFLNGVWVSNGTAKFHGDWCTGSFCGPPCHPELDAGSIMPKPGFGTKWRVAASAFAKNCTSDSGCYNDYKRVAVYDSGDCIPE
jgi:hypothetical protein